MGAPTAATIARFGQDERQQILKEYLDGTRTEVIGKNHGAGNNTIRFLLKEMDAPLRKPGEANAIDISGQRFGRLTAVKRTGRKLHGLNHEWLLLCDCGNIVNSTVHSVRSGNTNSCGCYGKDRITETQRLDVTGD